MAVVFGRPTDVRVGFRLNEPFILFGIWDQNYIPIPPIIQLSLRSLRPVHRTANSQQCSRPKGLVVLELRGGWGIGHMSRREVLSVFGGTAWSPLATLAAGYNRNSMLRNLSELAYHPFYGALKIGYKILDATERARADITAEGLPEVCTPSAVIR